MALELDPIATAQVDNLVYWAGRTAQTQEALTDKSILEARRQLAKYYASAQKSVISDFVATYQHLLLTQGEGNVTPADLYKLGRYWEMQAELEAELVRLNDKQAAALAKVFKSQYWAVYDAMALTGDIAYRTISKQGAEAALRAIWCADGKSWSARIWDNTDNLRQMLNDRLLETITAGRKPGQLKQDLMQAFDTSFYCADRVVRTECAHVSAIAAQQRYKDAGIEKMQVWASKDERRCDVCAHLHEKTYSVTDISPLPAHPNCRCTLIPVIPGTEGVL